ncbi:glycosyltransferase family 4 protein [Desulfatirhabdium butyrativorans]|uniref:glycosyltransferase family 4 protein n=1 Tax=Desulfatirhabdium butyrativorans TaxID=340467 RepID=UPI000420E517|nr:glycosyltransferase family 4 protein [Desulfatirhabdium butyrativorans]
MIRKPSGHRPAIAMIVPTYGRVGGAENLVVELCERLIREHGCTIHVLANRFEAISEAVHMHRIPIWMFPRWFRPYSFAIGVRKTLDKLPVDLVHSHERIFRADVFSVHGMPHQQWIRDVRKKSMSWFDRATARVERMGYTHPATRLLLPVSRQLQTALVDLYPSVERRIRVLTPGVSTRRFADCSMADVKARAKIDFGLEPTDTVLLFVGMNFEVKRLGLVMESLAILGRDVLDRHRLKLLVIGKGDIRRYVRLAVEMGIQNHIRFAGVQTDMAHGYAAGDVLVMPSRMDTFGLVVLEAMAAALPVILTRRVGAIDVVEGSGCGIVLDADPAPQALAEAIFQLADAGRRERLGWLARTTALSHDWKAVTAELVRLYDSLLNRPEGDETIR